LTLVAITRSVSPALNRCELGFLPRQEIDIAKAVRQHQSYEECLRELGATVISLPPEPDLPDSMFVEDPAVVVPEVAILTRMGAESRRKEADSLAPVLARFRPIRYMREPATLEGGDVLRVGSAVYVGLSSRTNRPGIEQLAAELETFGYSVRAVPIRRCLHLKSACSAIGGETLLVNPDWVDASIFEGFRIIEVPLEEPRAANVLAIGETVLVPDSFLATAAAIERLGWKVRTLDISELMKAEAGLTCSSILLENRSYQGSPGSS
jgi:dimethylargininase